jgi:hypothetical protein
LRYAILVAGGSADTDGPVEDVPNATDFLFDAVSLRRAADNLR